LPPCATLTIGGFEFTQVPEIDQGVQAGITLQEHTASTAAITTIRSTKWNEFLTAKRRRAVSAFTGNDFYCGFIYEFHGNSLSGYFPGVFLILQ
jgi:hypothetical protein